MTIDDRYVLKRLIEERQKQLTSLIRVHMNTILSAIDEKCQGDENERKKWYDEVEAWTESTIAKTFDR